MNEAMTDKQAKRADLQARLDELNRVSENTNDSATMEWIEERKKALRTALDSID